MWSVFAPSYHCKSEHESVFSHVRKRVLVRQYPHSAIENNEENTWKYRVRRRHTQGHVQQCPHPATIKQERNSTRKDRVRGRHRKGQAVEQITITYSMVKLGCYAYTCYQVVPWYREHYTNTTLQIITLAEAFSTARPQYHLYKCATIYMPPNTANNSLGTSPGSTGDLVLRWCVFDTAFRSLATANPKDQGKAQVHIQA